MDILLKYFTRLSPLQKEQYSQLFDLYQTWNKKINVVSRKDIQHLYERHVVHSLAIARIISFDPGSRILDAGTGGGFPGIPLAILFPDVRFHLVDSIGKKIRVVQAISNDLGLKNVFAEQARVETLEGQYDFIVSRAVTALPEFIPLILPLLKNGKQQTLPNGILYLKGGKFEQELKETKMNARVYPLSEYFDEAFFETKSLVHLFFQRRL